VLREEMGKKLEKGRVIVFEPKNDGETARKASALERFRKMTKNPSCLGCLRISVR